MDAVEITELLFVRDPPGRSDVAIVFGHHEPEVSARRVRHAASLLLGGHTSRLLLTGGKTDQREQSESEHMATVARSLGVPDDALHLEKTSRTTAENVSLSVHLLVRNHLLDSVRTAHLVSCPWHMRRVLHLSRAAFGPEVHLLSSPHNECCTAATWVSSAECRERVLAELRLVRSLLGR